MCSRVTNYTELFSTAHWNNVRNGTSALISGYDQGALWCDYGLWYR